MPKEQEQQAMELHHVLPLARFHELGIDLKERYDYEDTQD